MIVIVAILIAVVAFFAIRALMSQGPRPYSSGPVYTPPVVYDEPVFVEPNPIAELATLAAAEVVADVALDAVEGSFDQPGFDPGFDGGGGDQGGFDGF